ncbi:MAG TPA: Gfo/Idh/MocA family oxidoreductase [Candidatus Acidoferrum sp.]|nr:Gfo/Idh/MocA family oxidoreductase [Candidatus Acidoferrum sp.]
MSSAALAAASQTTFANPNDTIRVATIGLRGRGKDHIKEITAQKNVELVAVCDIDQKVLEAGAKDVETRTQKTPKTYTDYRKLLEDKSIDAISIATPNHWHTLMTIQACQAGKDVYVEKPCTHNLFEVKQITAAARKYNRMVQQGSQSRSSVALRDGIQKMRDGLIGDIYLSRGLCYKWRDTIGRKPESDPPSYVDYDLWTGPAQKVPYKENRFHYNWHWYWAYGNGDLGNQGIHEVDIARWGLGVKYPTKATAMGGKFMFDDDQETPNTITAAFEFNENGKKKMMEFEVRHWMSNHEAGINVKAPKEGAKPDSNTIGNIFYGEKGYMAIDGYTKYSFFMGREAEAGPTMTKGGSHFANFFEAMRSRKKEDLTAEVEEGAASTVLVHLANISYRLGRTINFDPKTLSITGDKEAEKMMTRDYRKPFVVPEKV